MPRGHKRKGTSSIGTYANAPVASTVPTLKEHIWSELIGVLQKYSTVPLAERDLHSSAMKSFR
jgi:hypothetical protein